MVHFVGAGPGAPDLITLRGAALLAQADVVIYAGSLVNPALLSRCKPDCRCYNSAERTLEQVLDLIVQAEQAGQTTVRLHTGDPSLYGAIQEQMNALDRLHIPYDVTPGVSSFSAAAAALQREYTQPGVTQTLILSRQAGRTPAPEQLSALATHGTSLALFLSAGLLEQVQSELLAGQLDPDTPAALVYKASWPEERIARCTVGTLAETGRRSGIDRTALVLVGRFLTGEGGRSLLYDPGFSTAFREGTP